MQIAGGDDVVFDRYMNEVDIVDVYERSALRLAHTYRPEEDRPGL